MNTLEAIKTRRSVKHFDPEHVMSQEEIDSLTDLATLSPTAFNIQNWRFVLVQDKKLRQEIREVSWNQAQVTDSSLLIVICADLKAWAKQPERYWANAPEEVRDFMLPAIQTYYESNEQVQRDEALRSCGIAAQTLMLAAKSMGYESCPMDGFDFEKVGELIQLPEDHLISMFVVIGKPLSEARPRAGSIPKSEVIVHDRFKSDS